MKRLFSFFGIFVLLFVASGLFINHTRLFIFFALLFVLCVGIYDVLQKKHAILRNFPILGHCRYILELIRPEIQQYFIAGEEEERPFTREERTIVYTRAKKVLDTIPFGTKFDLDTVGYESAKHSLKPTAIEEKESRHRVGGHDCQQPYFASRLNISAMSFGALSKNAVLALNTGAKLGDFAHNTGEGGLSPYHLAPGGDIIWQLGTANFGARTESGHLDEAVFKEKSNFTQVKMIEIKLSQGAKPSHGGILPAAKITSEIASIRGVALGKDCISPPTNPEFNTPEALLFFVQKLRTLSNGKPIGFKLAIGLRHQFFAICKAMLNTEIYPDFITVDGAEGGTGAAPLEFTNRLGEPIEDALHFVHNALRGVGLRDKVTLIASGKIITGFDILVKLALGADMVNSARGMMFALGCIQSLQCNRNTCPTGVTTQNPYLVRGLDVNSKAVRVAQFHQATVESFLELCGAMGIPHVKAITAAHVYRRNADNRSVSLAALYPEIPEGALLNLTANSSNAMPGLSEDCIAAWHNADPTTF